MSATVAKKKRGRPRSEDRHKLSLLGVRVTDLVRGQVQCWAKVERRSLAQMAAILIEEALQRRGPCPKPSEQEEG